MGERELRRIVTVSPTRLYPCRCLCLGFSQITIILPLRRMILHLSQIFLIDERTFMFKPLFKSLHRKQFHQFAILKESFLTLASLSWFEKGFLQNDISSVAHLYL
jgi:hypothetical protein